MYFIGNEKENSVFLSLTAERILVGRTVEKRIEVEKSSFGNGWRFFYALKERGDGRRRGKRGVRADGGCGSTSGVA